MTEDLDEIIKLFKTNMLIEVKMFDNNIDLNQQKILCFQNYIK